MTAAEDGGIWAGDGDVEDEALAFSDWPSCSRIGVTWLNRVSMCNSLVSNSWTYLRNDRLAIGDIPEDLWSITYCLLSAALSFVCNQVHWDLEVTHCVHVGSFPSHFIFFRLEIDSKLGES